MSVSLFVCTGHVCVSFVEAEKERRRRRRRRVKVEGDVVEEENAGKGTAA